MVNPSHRTRSTRWSGVLTRLVYAGLIAGLLLQLAQPAPARALGQSCPLDQAAAIQQDDILPPSETPVSYPTPGDTPPAPIDTPPAPVDSPPALVEEGIVVAAKPAEGEAVYHMYLPGIARIEPPGWPTLAGNPQRTSWTPEEVSGDLEPLWFHRFNEYISQKVQIIASGGALFISTSGGLYALDAATGAQRWFYPTSLPLGHSPTIYQDVAYVGGLDGRIHAVNAVTGQGLWTYKGGAGFHTNPLVVEDLAIAGNRDGAVYAVRISGLQTGQLAWKYQTGGPVLFSAAYKDGVIYFASNDGYAYALQAQSGSLVWKSAKLPGHEFHSWWPVIYRSQVIFTGTYNYRFVLPFNGEHTLLERKGIYEQPGGTYPPEGTPVGTVGTIPGDWAAGTSTISADKIAQYFETYPARRTTFVLNRSNGQEVTYDSDADGRAEYAPILWTGTHSGTRYPPAIGADGVLYQFNNFLSSSTIPRGGISGWKYGTQVISRPVGRSFAVDEPLAYAAGGSMIYWRLCCDRAAGFFKITGGVDETLYDTGGSLLRRTLPELFNAGYDFGYWKHGDPSAPIPYRGRLYLIANNAVVAFGPNGLEPVLPANEPTGVTTGVTASAVEKSTIVYGLNLRATFETAAGAVTWPLLYQQESYINFDTNTGVRGRFFKLADVTAASGAPSAAAFKDLGVTTLVTHTFSGGASLNTWVSERAAAVLFKTTATQYNLLGSYTGFAYQASSGVTVRGTGVPVNGSAMSAGWLLLWDATNTHRWSPVVVSLEKRPTQVLLDAAGLHLTYPGAAGHLAVTPLYGMSAPLSSESTSWPTAGISAGTVTRIQQLDRLGRAFPVTGAETWAVNAANSDVTLTYTYAFREFSGDWSTQPLRLAALPPALALAAWQSPGGAVSPIRINGQPLGSHLDLNIVTPLGRLAGVSGQTTATVVLPGLANTWKQVPAAPPAPAANDPLMLKLSAEISKMLAAGHLRPAYGLVGIWESQARGRMGDNLVDYFHNPAETFVTLLRALPLLPAAQKAQVRTYLQTEFAGYAPHLTSHVGWKDGASRDYFDLPPEVDAERVNFPTCASRCNNGWDLPQENFYAAWAYAAEFGNAGQVFPAALPKLELNPELKQSLPSFLNASIAGHIGILRLAILANAGVQPNVEKSLIDLLIQRVALSKYPAALQATGFEYGGYSWTLRVYAPNAKDTLFTTRMAGTLWSQMPLYGFPIDLIYGRSGAGHGGAYSFGLEFVNLTPETGNLLGDYALAESQAAVNSYNLRAPYWFVAKAEETGGEGVFQPLYDVVALFQAKAFILDTPRAQLEPYIDVPAVAIGDLYYLQNLINALSR